jgi:hypothetical protein
MKLPVHLDALLPTDRTMEDGRILVFALELAAL